MNTALDQSVSDAAFRAVRDAVNQSGYGPMVTDENCRALGDAAARAAITAYVILQAGRRPSQPLEPLG
jgi:hypothetical protein